MEAAIDSNCSNVGVNLLTVTAALIGMAVLSILSIVRTGFRTEGLASVLPVSRHSGITDHCTAASCKRANVCGIRLAISLPRDLIIVVTHLLIPRAA